jgi:hypothetical protein
MDVCRLCGRVLPEGSIGCLYCGSFPEDEPPTKDKMQSRSVFMMQVCTQCNGVVGVSCICDDGEVDGERERP